MKRRFDAAGNAVVWGVLATLLVACMTALVACNYLDLLSGCGSPPQSSDIKAHEAQGRLSAGRRASTGQSESVASKERTSQVSSVGVLKFKRDVSHWTLDHTRAMSGPTLLPPANSLVDSGPPNKCLCPLLFVPKGTRLNCIVPDEVRGDRQDTTFVVRGSNGVDLFNMLIAERGPEAPGVHVQTLDGAVQLAFLCTKDLFEAGCVVPSSQIFWPSGQRFASLSRTAANEYRVAPVDGHTLVFSGNLAECRIRAATAAGKTVAEVSQDTSDELRVIVHTLNDAGLIVLALVGIYKCERRAAAAVKER